MCHGQHCSTFVRGIFAFVFSCTGAFGNDMQGGVVDASPCAAPAGAVAPATAPTTAPARLAAPDAAAKAYALKILKEVYAKEYAQNSRDGKRALAGKLLTEAENSSENA